MKVPLLDLKLEYQFFKKEIDKNLKNCLKGQQWVLGPQVSLFEEEAARYLGVNYAIGVASGTDALLIGLRALSLALKNKEFFDKKDEIITSPFTFVATAEAIKRAGARPVFADINPDSFNVSPEEIKKALTKRSVGILPVHIYGQASLMPEIKKIAKENGLFILEDCAQSFGAAYPVSGRNFKKLGTFGEVGAFSFFPTKNLGGFGDGGLITAKRKKIADLIRILRNHGQVSQYRADYCGYNSRLDSFQAAVLSAKLKSIDKLNQKRIQIAQKYNQAFKDISQIQVPFLDREEKNRPLSHIYHLYTIKVPARMRDKLNNYLNSKGISARVYYPASLSQMKAFSSARASSGLKNTIQATKQVLSLPIYPFMEQEKIEYVIKHLKKGVKSN